MAYPFMFVVNKLYSTLCPDLTGSTPDKCHKPFGVSVKPPFHAVRDFSQVLSSSMKDNSDESGQITYGGMAFVTSV